MLKLHDRLVATLDAGDVEEFGQLVAQRATLIDDLQASWTAASPQAQLAIQPFMQQLASLDQDLQVRAQAVKDQLGRRLTESKQGGGHATTPAASGVFDRRA